MFFGIFVLNRVLILSIFVLNRVSFLRQEPITLFLDDKQPALTFYECLKLGIKNRNSVLNRVGKSAIFVLKRVRVWGAELHLPTQGYIEYPPPPGFVVARGRGPIQILKYFRPGYFVSPKTWPWFQILSTLIFKLGLETAWVAGGIVFAWVKGLPPFARL